MGTPVFIETENAMVVEMPKIQNDRYYANAEELWEISPRPPKGLYSPIGIDVNNDVVGINFSDSTSPHLLIGGATGGGKSVALQTILAGLLHNYSPDELELFLVDPKGNELVHFEVFDHVRKDMVSAPEEAIVILEYVVGEMNARYDAYRDLARETREHVPGIEQYNQLVPRENVTALDSTCSR